MLEVPLEAEEKSIVQSTVNNIVDNNISVQENSFDNSENILRNSRTDEVNEEPLSFREKNNENNLIDEITDESLYETHPTFNTRETVNSLATNNQSLSSTGRIPSNIDLSQSSATPKTDKSIKISLIGRIQVNGGFNQTPMLISFDAIPDESAATQSSVSTELSNTIKAIETTAINLSLNDSNAGSAFDLLSMSERANDEASDSLNAISGESRREAEKTNANKVRIKSREKLFDLTRKRGKERKTTKKNPSRIEKRLDKYNTNSRSAKQVFLTDYSVEPNSKVSRTNVGRMISERTGGTIGKLDSRSSANPVHFPDILGSVLVNNDSLKDRDAIKEPRRRIDVPTIETNRSNSIEIDPSNTTLHSVPLVHIGIEKPSVDLTNGGRTTCCPRENPWNATSGGCYRMPATVRKLEVTETTSRELQTSSNYRNDDPETFPPRFYETTANDRNAVTTRPSPSTRLPNGVLETAAKCNDGSINAVRVRNLMAIVRFMMKLLRIVAEDEEPPCPTAQIGETVIRVKNVVINASSHVERQKSTTDRTIIKSGRTRQDLTTAEWRTTIVGRMREESSPLGDGTFESFTEAPSHPAASTSSDEVSKDEGLSTLFETSTGKEVYTSALSSTTSFATLKSFLFYDPARKSPRKDASRKNTKVDLTGVKQNSNVSFKDSKSESGGEKSRLDGSQTNRSPSWSRDRDRNSADRLHFGKQGIACTTNPEDKIGSFRERYLAGSKNVGFWQPESGVANDTVRPILPRDIDVSRNALSERNGAARENRPRRSKSKKASKQAGVSDRRAETSTKLLNRSTRGGPPGDWIGERRAAARRLPIDKKLRESREVPDGTATLGKVVFRRVRGKINRPPDPNLVSGRSDSFKIERNVAGNGPLAKLSTDDALSTDRELSSLEREDTSGNAIRYSTSSLMNDNVGTSRIGREIVDEHIRIPYKKRDVSERRDFREGNRVLKERQKASSSMKKKTKQRRKKKRKKGGRRTRDISETENHRRFKRHLLMTSLEPEDDADDAAAGFSRRHVAVGKRNAEKFRKSAGSNARRRRRRKRDGSRTVDGSEADPGAAQIRGGQDCTDHRHPPNIDAAKYLESAHCLRFSDLW
ncbi:uncharacterized protein LOC143908147 [Temnothorax americanus]|uniref:uncharacterized protein LOC143908147 n=1 Tax=Temnothorax americanus TaxID=1964332 RepID=UPI0040675C50